MGESWFMGDERKMFDQLLGDIDSLSAEDLREPLEEIVSGFSSFGAYEEWVNWYHYLLVALIPRGNHHYLESMFEYLITGFIGLYPNGIEVAPYKGFRTDVMRTLGRCIMEKECWDGSDIVVGRLLHRSNNNPNKVWCWWNASGDFSSSMFFCLKYLPEEEIATWLKSVLRISSAHWRAQLIVWLVGANNFFQDEFFWPAELKQNVQPRVAWAWSHCLRANMESNPRGALLVDKPAFLPRENRLAALRVLREEITEHRYLEWLESMSSYPYLLEEMGHTTQSFEKLYLKDLRRR